MRPLATDASWSVCLSVCVCLSRPWVVQNVWTDRDVVWGVDCIVSPYFFIGTVTSIVGVLSPKSTVKDWMLGGCEKEWAAEEKQLSWSRYWLGGVGWKARRNSKDCQRPTAAPDEWMNESDVWIECSIHSSQSAWLTDMIHYILSNHLLIVGLMHNNNATLW